jgi:protocatechuate 3,4-dioxygenase beta subunit
VTPEPTPSQTVGPFFHDALLAEDRSELVPPDHPRAVRIEGTVYDGAGEPVPDAMVEIWQANEAGRYSDPTGDRENPPENLLGLRALGNRRRRPVLLRNCQTRPRLRSRR